MFDNSGSTTKNVKPHKVNFSRCYEVKEHQHLDDVNDFDILNGKFYDQLKDFMQHFLEKKECNELTKKLLKPILEKKLNELNLNHVKDFIIGFYDENIKIYQ